MAKETAKIGQDLENATENATSKKLSKNKPVENAPEFANREWLENNNPMDFINDETKSSKFEDEREQKIQSALPTIMKIQIDGVSINPLLILLATWWEVKPARAAIKKMIDAEAEAKGFDENHYLQNVLGAQVDVFSEIQTAIDRVRYVKTYFKPRKGITTKVITKLMSIDGVVYIVPVVQLEEAKSTIKDKEELKKAVIGFSTKQEVEVESL